MPRNMRGTLTSNNSKSVHTLIFNIILYKSCAVATPKHLGPCPPKNYVRTIAFPPILQRVSFCSVTKFLHYSTTIKLWPLIILIKGSYSSLRVSLRYWDIIISLVSAVARKFMLRIGTSNRSESLVQASPASHNQSSWCNLPRVAVEPVAVRSLGKRPTLAPQPCDSTSAHASGQPTQFSKNTYRIRHLTRLWPERVG